MTIDSEVIASSLHLNGYKKTFKDLRDAQELELSNDDFHYERIIHSKHGLELCVQSCSDFQGGFEYQFEKYIYDGDKVAQIIQGIVRDPHQLGVECVEKIIDFKSTEDSLQCRLYRVNSSNLDFKFDIHSNKRIAIDENMHKVIIEELSVINEKGESSSQVNLETGEVITRRHEFADNRTVVCSIRNGAMMKKEIFENDKIIRKCVYLNESLNQQIEYSYCDDNGNLIKEVQYEMSGSCKQIRATTEVAYDGNGNEILRKNYRFINGIKLLISKTEVRYDKWNEEYECLNAKVTICYSGGNGLYDYTTLTKNGSVTFDDFVSKYGGDAENRYRQFCSYIEEPEHAEVAEVIVHLFNGYGYPVGEFIYPDLTMERSNYGECYIRSRGWGVYNIVVAYISGKHLTSKYHIRYTMDGSYLAHLGS